LQEGQLEVARMLIERGVDVSAQDKDGQTPLHLASQRGQLELARMLIEHDADVSAQDKDGKTPLHLASQGAQNNDGQTSWVSFGNGNDLPPFLSPLPRRDLDSGHPDIARMLIERGADVSAQDKDGRTPMYLASQAGELTIIRILVVHGADVFYGIWTNSRPFLFPQSGLISV
jgi:ankyrin repeat protein